jgi:pimeloyl-ACP methyl ester carboxylesterase
MTLIGHSWGAWLSFIFTARNPSFVKKLILISSGAFEKKYASDVMRIRLNRLTEDERATMESLSKMLEDPERKDKDKIFTQYGQYISKADSFHPLHNESEDGEYQYSIYESVWNRAKEMRSSGELLFLGKLIQCPVVAIHGDFDPHPADGVRIPLSSVLKNFNFILLRNCGHRPWIERGAKGIFYEILKKEL